MYDIDLVEDIVSEEIIIVKNETEVRLKTLIE